MQSHQKPDADRRAFLRIAGLGVAAAGTLFSGTASAQGASVARQLTEPEKLSRIASCCWPPRLLFKAIGGRQPSEEALSLRKKPKIWMDAAAVLGAKTMRANTGVSGTRIMPEAAPHETGYPKNDITDNLGSGNVHRTRRELLPISGHAVTSPARRVTLVSGRRRCGRGAPPRPSSTRRRPR